MEKISGRKPEIALLQKTLESAEAGLVAVYGRRRVGKTFLIREYYKDHIVFEQMGMYGGSLKEQLMQFSKSMQKATGSILRPQSPDSWVTAFHALEQYLDSLDKKKKSVVFLDEFPWLDSRRSRFLSAFTYFWNVWASRQSNLVIVICGSAASWMIRNIVNNKGGLHQRITQKIRLLPFTLAETAVYIKSLHVRLDHYQLLQLYMAFGGIPQYLKTVQSGDSATVAIENACFAKDGLLKGEFSNLYDSLFEIAENHIKAVRALSRSQKGLTRQEIIEECRLSSGGTTTLMLEELEESGFIQSSVPYKKVSHETIYRLTDEYTLFYLKFMDGKKISGKNAWSKLSASNSYKVWSGMAFESVCLKHVESIKTALGIDGLQTEESSWRHAGSHDNRGVQIDLLIDRSDRCINICEMKFYTDEFVIDKAYAASLETKMDVFKEQTKTKKNLFLTMITTFGTKQNQYSTKLVQKDLKMDVLFN